MYVIPIALKVHSEVLIDLSHKLRFRTRFSQTYKDRSSCASHLSPKESIETRQNIDQQKYKLKIGQER